MNDNPYASPKSESAKTRLPNVRSRVWWFIIPAIAGAFVGNNAFAGAFGTTPGDPFGTARPAGIGGFVGLLIGVILHRLTRPIQHLEGDSEASTDHTRAP